MIYQFRTGNTYRGVDAQTVGEELERIRRASGDKLLTTDVLKWAAEPDSPIHSCFTWDTEKAAHEYNLHEARQLIKAVVIVKEESDSTEPAFWNIAISIPASEENEPPTEERYYQAAAVVAQNPKEYEAALRVVLRELTSAQRGLEKLRSLAPRGKKTKVDRAAAFVGSAHEALQ